MAEELFGIGFKDFSFWGKDYLMRLRNFSVFENNYKSGLEHDGIV